MKTVSKRWSFGGILEGLGSFPKRSQGWSENS